MSIEVPSYRNHRSSFAIVWHRHPSAYIMHCYGQIATGVCCSYISGYEKKYTLHGLQTIQGNLIFPLPTSLLE